MVVAAEPAPSKSGTTVVARCFDVHSGRISPGAVFEWTFGGQNVEVLGAECVLDDHSGLVLPSFLIQCNKQGGARGGTLVCISVDPDAGSAGARCTCNGSPATAGVVAALGPGPCIVWEEKKRRDEGSNSVLLAPPLLPDGSSSSADPQTVYCRAGARTSATAKVASSSSSSSSSVLWVGTLPELGPAAIVATGLANRNTGGGGGNRGSMAHAGGYTQWCAVPIGPETHYNHDHHVHPPVVMLLGEEDER